MFQHQGIWLPDGEKHFPDWMNRNGELVDGKGTYQIKKLRAAMEHCKQFRVAVDVGAHVGLWSMHLLKRFQFVHAFEPVMEFRQCWTRNVPIGQQAMCDVEAGEAHADIIQVNKAIGSSTAILYGVALGAEKDSVFMAYDPADSGGTHVATGDKAASLRGTEPVEMRALDEFDFADVDFIKLDCEGFEHQVLAGARDTLVRSRPCVIVEQKPHKLGPNYGIRGTPAVEFLRGLGARVVREMGGDYIMVFD